MPDPPLHQATPVELKARLVAERRGTPFLLVTDDGGRRRLAEYDRLRFGTTSVVFRAPVSAQRTTTQGTSLGVDSAGIVISAAQRRVLVALARPCLLEGSFATPATNRQIAEELFPGVDAVKTHLRALTLKFGIQDLPQNSKRARLVELTLQNGEISERDLEAGS